MLSHTALLNCEILALLLVVLQANLKLANRFVRCPDRIHAMSAKIVGRMFQMFFGAAQRPKGFPDLRMPLGWICGRCSRLAGCPCNSLSAHPIPPPGAPPHKCK